MVAIWIPGTKAQKFIQQNMSDPPFRINKPS
jgi:hypothetical protein